MGFYHTQLARRAKNPKDKEHHYVEAAKHYIKAALTFPEDDEFHPYFLAVALELYWLRGTPLRLTLPLCKQIRLAIPKIIQ